MHKIGHSIRGCQLPHFWYKVFTEGVLVDFQKWTTKHFAASSKKEINSLLTENKLLPPPAIGTSSECRQGGGGIAQKFK